MTDPVNQTDWSFVRSTGVVNQTVTIPATVAGNKLVLIAIGGATVTGKITNSAGAAFTSRGQSLGAMAVSIHEFVAVGGETAVYLTLNGAENIAGTILEYANLGTFVSMSTGTTVALSAAGDYQSKPTTSVSLSSGQGVVIAAWAALTSVAFSASMQFRQMGPSGVLRVSGKLQPGANTQFIYAAGQADVAATQRYPGGLAAVGDFRATSMLHGSTANTFCVQVLYTNTSGSPVNPAVSAVVAENRLPGTLAANWWLGTSAVTDSTLAGYTDKVSYAAGDTVNFKVDSTSNAFRVEVYRLGFYGREGYAARNVLGAGTYITGTPAAQSAPTVDSTLGSTSCAWSTTASWTIPADAAPGVYVYNLRRTDIGGHTAFGHFVVRGATVTGKNVVVLPDSTYQAYNVWGATTDAGNLSTGTWTGRSLYQIGTDGGVSNFAHRGYAVSFDRPYSTEATLTQTSLLDSEIGTIAFLEAQGYDLTYLSDWDLDTSSTLLNAAALVSIIGHSEYWTTGIYNCLQNAVTAGVNLFFDSSNTALWRTRYAAADTGRRTMICYKDSGTRATSAGFTGTGYDPLLPTGTWRDTAATNGTPNPDRRVENALTGQIFVANAAINTNHQVAYAQRTSPIWRNAAAVQALTAGTSYTTVAATVGYELDAPDGGATQPANLAQLNPTVMSFAGHGVNADGTIYTGAAANLSVGFTLVRDSSGALIFNTGSWRGMWGTTRWRNSSTPSGSVDLAWQNAFLAILYDLGQVPSTLTVLEPGDTTLTNPSTGAPTGGRNGVAAAYGLTVGGPVTVAGFAGNVGSAAGLLGALRAVLGTGPAAGSGLGDALRSRGLDGSAGATAFSTGALAGLRPLAGTGPEAAFSTGELGRAREVTGQAGAASSGTGDLIRGYALAGFVAAVSAASGVLTAVRAVTGVLAAVTGSRGELDGGGSVPAPARAGAITDPRAHLRAGPIR